MHSRNNLIALLLRDHGWKLTKRHVRRVHRAWIKPNNALLKVGWFSVIGRETPMPIGDWDDYATFPAGRPAWKSPARSGASLTEKKWWSGSNLRGFWLGVVVCAIISPPLQTDAFLSKSKWSWKVDFVSKSISCGTSCLPVLLLLRYGHTELCMQAKKFSFHCWEGVGASCMARDAAASSPESIVQACMRDFLEI